jgi:hypothetical protein
MRRRHHVAVWGAVIAVAGGAAVLAFGDRGGTAAARPAAPATADITLGDLVDTASVDGRLTYAGERGVVGRSAGTITSVPTPGSVIVQGKALYQVDRSPVVLMYGALPLYRPLRQGIEDGPDVRQLEQALRALGHGNGLTVDTHFSVATAQAVREWQRDIGLPRTGSVTAAQVVFLPAEVRVAAAKVVVGDTVLPGRQVLALTGTRRFVHVDLKASDQELARKGAGVTVELPDGGTVRGRIASVGTVARRSDPGNGSGASGQSPEATIGVEIRLDDARKTGRLDQAPVTVTLERARRKSVLSVPVEALLALREGGFGLEVVEPGGTRRTVGVRTGAYGGGRVEITGSGLTAGMKVAVPAQ